MKISKLFHWLYAILMFLPILVFIPNAFYYGFNEQAIAQEKIEDTNVYYNTNEITNVGSFVIGNVYSYTNNYTPVVISETYTNLMYIDIKSGSLQNSNGLLFIEPNGKLTYKYGDNYVAVNLLPFDFVVLNFAPNLNSMPNELLAKFTICETKYIKTVGEIITTNISITDSMSYAWKSTWQNELFSWSYDSFLTQPFLYITNLFNVPATNTLLYCLSYWLNISIIWLCFDVVMYVPLLVHRWLDKGIVE